MIHYCVVCGSKLRSIKLPTEERERLVCEQCGHIHYVNPRVVSGAIPVDGGRIWLLRRGIEPRLGYWTYPAGYQEIDESTPQAAIREALEELGCDIALDGLLGVYSRPDSHVVNVVYTARLIRNEKEPRVTPEAIEVHAFKPTEIPWGELAFPSTQQAMRDWVAQWRRETQGEGDAPTRER